MAVQRQPWLGNTYWFTYLQLTEWLHNIDRPSDFAIKSLPWPSQLLIHHTAGANLNAWISLNTSPNIQLESFQDISIHDWKFASFTSNTRETDHVQLKWVLPIYTSSIKEKVPHFVLFTIYWYFFYLLSFVNTILLLHMRYPYLMEHQDYLRIS